MNSWAIRLVAFLRCVHDHRVLRSGSEPPRLTPVSPRQRPAGRGLARRWSGRRGTWAAGAARPVLRSSRTNLKPTRVLIVLRLPPARARHADPGWRRRCRPAPYMAVHACSPTAILRRVAADAEDRQAKSLPA